MEANNNKNKNVLHEHGAHLRSLRSYSTVQSPLELAAFSSSYIPFFTYKTSDFIYNLRQCLTKRLQDGFKTQLLNQWYLAKKKKVFNYNLNCIYKLLDGEYNLSLQLNTDRGKLRRKPMRFQNICQPFNHLRFNFTKLKDGELLYHLRCIDRPYTEDKLDIHSLAINASPLEKGHSLILPAVNKCLPQNLNVTAIRIAVDMMLLIEDEHFHILFNSLLGQASVNHLHLHTIFWPYESGIISRECNNFYENIFTLNRPNWFIQAFVFQLKSASQFDNFVLNISRFASFLTTQNVAHNLFMSRAPNIKLNNKNETTNSNDTSIDDDLYVTAYLFPRRNQTGAKPPTNFNPASAELAGFLTAYTFRFFESASEQTALRIIDEDAVLSDYVFDSLCDSLIKRLKNEISWDVEHFNNDINSLIFTSTRRNSSDNGSINNDTTVNSLSELGIHEVESLSSHELDELTDAFHSVTSPIPRIRHYNSFSSSLGSVPSTLVSLFNKTNELKNEKKDE